MSTKLAVQVSLIIHFLLFNFSSEISIFHFSCAPQVAPVPCQAASYAQARPSYSAPSKPSYSAPPKPSYSAPSYSAPAAPSYSAPAAPSYRQNEEAAEIGAENPMELPTQPESSLDVKKADW